jgi:hypothetical protein
MRLERGGANFSQFIAKAFLEKDYEAAKAKRTVNTVSEPVVPTVVDQQNEDVTMTDSSVVPKKEKPAAQPGAPSDTNLSEQASGEAPYNIDVVSKKSPEASVTAPKMEVKASTKSQDAGELNHSFPDPSGQTLNFNGPNEFDLNLDFGNDDVGNQNFLAGTQFLDSSSTNMAGDGAENPASISSLLPGLESYAANTEDENFNFDFNKLPGDSAEPQTDDSKNYAHDEMAVHGESSFDDLFMEKDNFGGDGDDNLLGDNMDLGEIDDSWFT